MDIYAHVNYFESEYPKLNSSADETFEMAARMGFDGIELRSPREGVPYTIEEAGGLARKHGLKNVSFGGNYDAMVPDAASRAANRDRFIEHIRAAGKIGTRYFNCQTGALFAGEDHSAYAKHGSAAATEAHWDQATEMLRAVGKVAREEGIVICLETHMCYLHDRAHAAKRLLDAVRLDNVKANLDWGNIRCFQEETEQEVFDILKDDIGYVHLKNSWQDSHGKFHGAGLADGSVNTFSHLRALKRLGYKGPLVPEAPRPGDRRWFARQDLAYIRDILSALDWE